MSGPAWAVRSGLLGVFGVDFILRDDIPWVVEVNPRPTSALEVLELAGGDSILGRHLNAFEVGPHPKPPEWNASRMRMVGKATVFAPEDLIVPNASWPASHPGPWSSAPAVADLPRPGAEIPSGGPVFTVFAYDRTLGACRRTLRHRVRTIGRMLTEWRSESG